MALERAEKEGMNEGEGEGQEEVGNKIVERREDDRQTREEEGLVRHCQPSTRAPSTEHRTPEPGPGQGQHFIFLNPSPLSLLFPSKK
jgi:hypothetical protein